MYDNTDFSFPPGLFAFCGILLIIVIASYWKIFTKAGVAGWKAIIPIYNWYVLLKIVGKPGWWLILFFIPIVNIVFIIWTYNMLSKSFGKDEAFTVGLILLGIVFFPILAFGSAKYLGPYGNKQEFENRNLKNYEFGKE
ncbi:MAG: DUF5684 domain-containing protein [Bacteroidota bacterium]|nr:DUF5684 domain-containing protein [Bacteroidota bacterium]